MRTIGPYKIIGVEDPEDGAVSEPEIVWFDTSVLIDLETFYFGTGKLVQEREHLRDVLLAFPRGQISMTDVRVFSGPGIAEASWSRSGVFDHSRARRMRHMARQILRWSPDEVRKAFANRHAPIGRDKSWPPPLEVSTDPNNFERTHPLPLLVGSYGYILYLSHLARTQSEWEHKGKLWALEEVNRWAMEEIDVRFAYETYLAVALFLEPGTQMDLARKMLKLGRQPKSPDDIARWAYGVAWDLWFLRQVDGSSVGYSPHPGEKGARPTCVVTKDGDPLFVRRNSRVATVITDGKSPLVFMHNHFGDSLKHQQEVGRLLDFEPSNIMDLYYRGLRDSEELLERAMDAVDRLELSLGVQERTVPGYRATL